MEQDLFLDSITRTIRHNDPTAEAFLFGSRARGDNRIDSDWDILILIDNKSFTNEIDEKFRTDLYDLEVEAGQIISTFIYPKDNWKTQMVFSPLYKNIKKEGIRL